jgi:hypothetical protein
MFPRSLSAERRQASIAHRIGHAALHFGPRQSLSWICLTAETPMKFVLLPSHLVLIILSSCVNHEQKSRIEYLQSELAVLKEHIGRKRILLTDAQLRRLAVKGKMIGRKGLNEVVSLFTPDTILRWHRHIAVRKWNYSDREKKQPGRPRTHQVNVDLTLKFAKENPTWGYDRISGALSNVGTTSATPRSATS